ncbi:MAG: GNAT family N-acetyltransferase [Anaerolineae bacterium]|nr:GNAT family N-acetyltransferase [Anaerolineae bacterium]
MTITYRAAADVDFEAFTAAFNLAYSDYHVPISMTPNSFRSLLARDDLDLTASVVALDGDTIVGTGLLGIRIKRGWIGGMGVIPDRRRQGIGRGMMRYLLHQAQTRNLNAVRLEVIEANTGAHALYRQLGFEHQRYLLILERYPAPLSPASQNYAIEEHMPESLLDDYVNFHDVSPNCWQRDLRSLRAIAPHAEGWAARADNAIVGYAIGWASTYGIRLIDLATDPVGNRAAITQALLTRLHQQYPEAQGNIYNLAEDDPVVPGFEAAGYTVAFRQIEMKLV